jgi:hypothetical protein
MSATITENLITETLARSITTARHSPLTATILIRKTKYCRGCGSRLHQPDECGNLFDGAYWKFDYYCLRCRLVRLFLCHDQFYKGS